MSTPLNRESKRYLCEKQLQVPVPGTGWERGLKQGLGNRYRDISAVDCTSLQNKYITMSLQKKEKHKWQMCLELFLSATISSLSSLSLIVFGWECVLKK